VHRLRAHISPPLNVHWAQPHASRNTSILKHTPPTDKKLQPCASPKARPNTTPFTVFTLCPPHLRPISQLIPHHWQLLLSEYPDPEFTCNIIGIATHGARIGYSGPTRKIKGDNHESALRIPMELDNNIALELAAGRIKAIKKLPDGMDRMRKTDAEPVEPFCELRDLKYGRCLGCF
jgi:hypothetical protein